MLPLKFYQLHFQVRKNISTSKRFQKHLNSGQQILPPGRRSLDLLSCWVRLGITTTLPTSSCLPPQTHALLQTAYSVQGHLSPFLWVWDWACHV